VEKVEERRNIDTKSEDGQVCFDDLRKSLGGRSNGYNCLLGLTLNLDRTRIVRKLTVKRGASFPLPLLLPVYRPSAPLFSLDNLRRTLQIDGCMVNAFFLYKDRDLRRRFRDGLTLADYIGFDGLLCTDSGAFQGFTRTLLLSNKEIIRFQNRIRTDIGAPLDLVTPPGDNRTTAEDKLAATQKRIREGLPLAEHFLLAGVQQGGRFLDLRHQSVVGLMEMGVEYLAIGSLVPFFNRNHDLGFVSKVLRDARSVAGPDMPMHVYGAGDPVELPFLARLGTDIFDSSSYAHFAKDGWYMTPYGAIRDAGVLNAGEYRCECPICTGVDNVADVFAMPDELAFHNLCVMCHTVARIRRELAAGTLDAFLAEILERHAAWFPDSLLVRSWESVHA